MVTFASNYGEQYRRWNGVDATIDARVRNGLLFQGGVSTGKESTDNCEVVRKLPETIAGGVVQSLDYCHGEQPYQTHVKGLGSYSLPWWGLQVSGAFQSSPQTGVQNVLGLASIGGVQANVTYPNAVIAPSLGRNLSTGTTAVVNVLQLGKLYDDRLNQIDVRIAKRAQYRQVGAAAHGGHLQRAQRRLGGERREQYLRSIHRDRKHVVDAPDQHAATAPLQARRTTRFLALCSGAPSNRHSRVILVTQMRCRILPMASRLRTASRQTVSINSRSETWIGVT